MLSRRVEMAAARFVDALVLEGIDRVRAAALVSAFAEKIAGKKAKTGQPDVAVASVIVFYQEQYTQVVGEPPTFDYGQAAAILQRLIRRYGVLPVQARLRSYLHSQDPATKESGFALPMFEYQWNRLAVRAAERRTSGACPHEPVCRSFAACRARVAREG